MTEAHLETQGARSPEADREIVITRLLDAPRALVWQAWVDPARVAQWWGPLGFTITIHEMAVHPGGVWRFLMHGPDGVDYTNKIVYREVVEPERLVYDHGPEDDDAPGHFQMTVTFAEQDGKTLLTMRSLFATAAERDRIVKEVRAIERGNQTIDCLAAHLAQR